MDEKLKKELKYLFFGYMLFFCIAVIPYFLTMIVFAGENLLTVIMLPLMAWWIFFFIVLFGRDLGHEAKYIKKQNAMKQSYKLSMIFSGINFVLQVLVAVFAKKFTPLPMILAISQNAKFSIILAVLALFFGSMILAPFYMRKFTNADVGYYVKHTTKTYLDFGYSETTTSDRFILSGQFVKASLLTSFLSILLSLTPATIIVFFVSYKRMK